MKKFNFQQLAKPPPRALSRASWIFGWLPTRLSHWLLVAGSKPTGRPRDVQDVLQEDPYTIEEVVQGKVWRVKYQHEDAFIIGDALKAMMDLTSEECMAAIIEEAEKEKLGDLAREDLGKMKEIKKMPAAEGKAGGYIRAGTMSSNMFVVKMNSGSLLLYSPVHVHKGSSLDKWIQSMGTVQWIIMGSSAHTLQLSSTTATFPDALVVGHSDAEAKLQAVSALPRGKLDYDVSITETNSSRGLAAAKNRLSPEGVDLYSIAGDCMSQSLWVLAHNVMIEIDILYTHLPECGCDQCDTTGPQYRDPAFWNMRIAGWLFKSSFVTNQDYGLPYYRWRLVHEMWWGEDFAVSTPSVSVVSFQLGEEFLTTLHDGRECWMTVRLEGDLGDRLVAIQKPVQTGKPITMEGKPATLEGKPATVEGEVGRLVAIQKPVQPGKPTTMVTRIFTGEGMLLTMRAGEVEATCEFIKCIEDDDTY